jgi:hypothetical protein
MDERFSPSITQALRVANLKLGATDEIFPRLHSEPGLTGIKYPKEQKGKNTALLVLSPPVCGDIY